MAKSSGAVCMETVTTIPIDDVLLPSQGAQQLDCLLAAFSDLDVPIAEEKLEGPGTVVTFLGVEVDTEAMVLRLSQRKIIVLKELIRTWLGKGSCMQAKRAAVPGGQAASCSMRATSSGLAGPS